MWKDCKGDEYGHQVFCWSLTLISAFYNTAFDWEVLMRGTVSGATPGVLEGEFYYLRPQLYYVRTSTPEANLEKVRLSVPE